jgi:hypothetical protein
MRHGILLVLIMMFAGCSTAPPQPTVIEHKSIQSTSQTDKTKIQEIKEPADESIVALLETLQRKNLISAEEMALIAERSSARAAREKKQLQEQVRKEIQEELPRKIKDAAAPEWTRRIRFYGDIRLRYERDFFDKNNADLFQPANPSQLMNTRINQDRFKYRLRFGAEAQVNEKLDAVCLFATGNTSNPVSTNTILGDYLNKDNLVLNLAYLRYHPGEFLSVSGGRIPNPWYSASWLVWDDDLNFEGLALHFRQPITESFESFLTLGTFPLDQYEFSSNDKWLKGVQLGFERKGTKDIAAKIGAAYYHFDNITGQMNNPLRPNEKDWTAPQYQQKGNTLFNINPNAKSEAEYKTALASEFRELYFTGHLDIGFWDPYHVVFLGEYVENLGFNKAEVARRTGNRDQTEETRGYQIGMSLGCPKADKSGVWKTYLQYRHIEADAVVDAFTDSDFHLGGTNAKGWIWGAEFGLLKNTWLTFKWLTADEISGPPLSIDVLFLDFNTRF